MKLRRRTEIRLAEWSLSLLAVGLTMGTLLTAPLWFGVPLYILFGGLGLFAIARDTERHSPDWGLLIWSSVGGFVGQNLLLRMLGAAEPFPLLWGSAGAFLFAALLADYRRERLPAIVISLLVAVLTGFFSFYFLAAVQHLLVGFN